MVDAAATICSVGAARRERRSAHCQRPQTARGSETHHPIRAALHVRIQVLVREEELERKRLEARGGQGLAHRAAPPALPAALCFQRARLARTWRVWMTLLSRRWEGGAALETMTWHARRPVFGLFTTFAAAHRRLDTTEGPDS